MTMTNPAGRFSRFPSRRLLIHLILIGAVVWTAGPLLLMLGVSFKGTSEVFANPLNPVPLQPTLENYQFMMQRFNIPRQAINSVIFAGGVTLAQILVAIPAAYAFARWRFPGSSWLFALLLLSIPIPFVVYYVPNYILMAQRDWLNTYWGMILPQAASAYGIFLLRQHFRGFPIAIIEAARLDGASEWRLLWQIVLPNTIGALVALALIIFIGTWNEYVWPLLVAPDRSMYTLTVGVGSLAGGEGGNRWGATMATAVIASALTLIAYLLSRRRLLDAMAEGAVK